MTRPALLFYCQHSVGLGHLRRSLRLAEELAHRFHVVLLNGGPFPDGVVSPPGVEVVDLAPLGLDDDYELVSRDPAVSVDEAMARRRVQLLTSLERRRPAVVVVELYPFGRKKFAFELEPFLAAVGAAATERPVTICSVRDLLVTKRRDQERHDTRAALTVNRYFDAVLVHSDPRFAVLDETFRPSVELDVPVHHTGFVAPPPPVVDGPVLDRVLVSAGGGLVGEELLVAAISAAPEILERTGLTTTLVAGPFLPDEAWSRLVRCRAPGVEVLRSVADLCAEMARSRVSVSQGGYNTTMDILRSGVASVVVPYSAGKEDEQAHRAGRLAAAGALRVLESADLSRLVDEVTAAFHESVARPSRPHVLDLDGARRSAEIVAELAHRRAGSATHPDVEVRT